MTQQQYSSYPTVRLQAAGDQPVGPVVQFAFAPDQPQVGLPGAQAGDVLAQQREAGEQVLLVSLGKAAGVNTETLRKAGGSLGRWLVSHRVEQATLDLETTAQTPLAGQEAVQGLLEGLVLGAYRFRRYKQAEPDTPQELTLSLRGGQDLELIIRRVQTITDAVIFARDLAHEPANQINPITLAQRAAEVAEQAGLELQILDETGLRQLGAGAILAVGQGSSTPPRMIVLRYAGNGAPADAHPVVLVGKAITFDTGGYSLKSTEGIVGMKYDKCGGVAVLAVMRALAALEIRTPVVGIIGAAENMVSSSAYRPDDIITTLNGKTVEIISTDAEGRLVLADALTYAQREYHPRALIDLATLTGGVVVALGRVRGGLLSNNDELSTALHKAGEATFERLWRLPLDEEYGKMMKGDDADLKNSGGREGHCILGGAFLQEFIEEGTAWAHLDIAGVADTPKDLPYAAKGATGFGVRLLIEYLQGLQD